MEYISVKDLQNCMTYAQYLAKTIDLLKEGKTSTTEIKPNPKIHTYMQENVERMHRLNAAIFLTPETFKKLATITEAQTWLTISEGWCGDASQVVPIVERMAAANQHITHRLIFREEHLDIMDAFLTEGGRSIPKTIVLDGQGKVLNAWGPRPTGLQIVVDELRDRMSTMTKDEQKAYFEDIKKIVHDWYDTDKTLSTQSEFRAVL
jgi:Thioredoxin